jgi:hypothetical protein
MRRKRLEKCGQCLPIKVSKECISKDHGTLFLIETIDIKNDNTAYLASFLSTICESLSNDSLNKSLVINLIENILECLGVSDLADILTIISEQVCSFGNLEEADQNKLLRIINHLLKRISKTEDYHIRG